MSFSSAPWDDDVDINEGNVRHFLDNLYSKFQPLEQARWNQSNIDTKFYAGDQRFVNNYFSVAPGANNSSFYFNLLQQPINMVTGYQRQHRKNFNYIPVEGSDTQTTDQYNKLMTACSNRGGIHEMFSRACEQACVNGMVLLQPYLDYSGSDPAQGEMKLKLWEYNSFLCDPYARELDFSDSNFVWTQEYISKREARARFPDKFDKVVPMQGAAQRSGSFYFLPENYNMARNDLLVLSYVWRKSTRRAKKLYSASRDQFFDFSEKDALIDEILYNIPDMELVEIDVPAWKLSVVLNDQLMFQGDNPLGFDSCPFIPVTWNYEPYNNEYDLRVRGLVRTMRDSNYLLNRRVNINHDISEATINAGWIRKSGAVANEDNLKKSGQGWDVIINEGYEITDCQKIQPSSVPESDMALADQLQSLIFATSGVNLESWSAENSPQASSLTVLMKQAANLMVLQKYFDQWDLALKNLGDVMLKIVLNNWGAGKVGLMINEDPSPYFYSPIFSNYSCVVAEGVLTPTQQYQEYQGWLELNQQLGGIIPAEKMAEKAPIQGKTELMAILQEQREQQAAAASELQSLQHALEEAKLQEMHSKSVANVAMAKERYGRYESDLGLKDERESELTKNRALATKAKMEALEKMVDVTERLGEIETRSKLFDIDQMQDQDIRKEDQETAKSQAEANQTEFMAKIMGNQEQQASRQQAQPQPQQPEQGMPQMGPEI